MWLTPLHATRDIHALYRDVLWNVWPRMRPQARPLVKKQIMYLIRYKKKWCMSINVRILVVCLLWWVITHQNALKGPRAFIHWADGRLTARSREVSKPRDSGLDFSIALKVNRHIGSSAAEMPVKFQSDLNNITPNLRLRDFRSRDLATCMSRRIVNRGPRYKYDPPVAHVFAPKIFQQTVLEFVIWILHAVKKVLPSRKK